MDKRIQKLLKKKVAFVGSSADNKPYIKAMLVSGREGNKVFYFDSNNGAKRTAQWKENPNACVYFRGGIFYKAAMLSGTVEIINDMETKQKFWKPSMKAIYKGGVTDPDYCVLKFTAASGRFYAGFKSEDFEV